MSEEDPYSTPQSSLTVENEADTQPVGFWLRVIASFVDTLLMLIVIIPLAYVIYGAQYFESEQFLLGFWDGALNYAFPAIATFLFWRFRGATPGKMLVGARVVDARTGQAPSTGQLIGRYFGYFPSMLILFLGFLWVAWDPKKQGWHDKLAGTMVVKNMPVLG